MLAAKEPAFAAVLASHASSKALQLMRRHLPMKWRWRATGMSSMDGMLHVIPVSPPIRQFRYVRCPLLHPFCDDRDPLDPHASKDLCFPQS